MTKFRVTIIALALASLVAGCGGSKNSEQSNSTAPQQQSSAPSSAKPLIDVMIKNGRVNPTNAEFTAKVHQPIEILVSSDAADELHVHSVPDHTFQVEAKPNQSFQFTVDVPGTVEVELHKLDRTVATIQVQQ
ncbi:MAG TPA: hypothetical protein VH496_02810 [Mycobacterium sp.]|jgi:PBP1b-binding outer membrane lipoprotein LpoB